MSERYEEHRDEASGHSYYVNKKSRQSFWSKEEAAAHAEDLSKVAEGKDENSAVETAIDASSGVTYFINKKTRNSFWTIDEVTVNDGPTFRGFM
jgi:hypothetical protein